MNRLSNTFIATPRFSDFHMNSAFGLKGTRSGAVEKCFPFHLVQEQFPDVQDKPIEVKVSNKPFKNAVKFTVDEVANDDFTFCTVSNGNYAYLPCRKWISKLAKRNIKPGCVVYVSVRNV
jgi:hypothetical protein